MRYGVIWVGIFLVGLLIISGCGQNNVQKNVSLSPINIAPISAASLLKRTEQVDVTISPDGQSIAYLKRQGERANIWLRSVSQPSKGQALIITPGRSVRNYVWSTDGQYIVYMSGSYDGLNTSNSDGKDFTLYRLDIKTGESFAISEPLDRRAKYRVSQQFPDKVFIGPSTRGARARVILTTSISTGKWVVSKANDNHAPIYADDGLAPRLATHWRDKLGYEVFRRGNDGVWKTALELDFADRLQFKVFGFSHDGRTAYLSHTQSRDRAALIALNLETNSQEEIASHKDRMIVEILPDQTTGVPIAYRAKHLTSTWYALNLDYKDDFDRLQNYNSGDLFIESRSDDNQMWIISYGSASDVRQYYLYERGRVPQLLFADITTGTQPNKQPTFPVSARSHDGFEITGYLTLPKGSDANHDGVPDQALPTIIWIHGGPWGRMSNEFDAWAQWMASRGYAALNVNFRGSTGFGKRFIQAHYGEWGEEMNRDVLVLVDWAIEHGITDPKKIAIAGESYGGYATLSLISETPDKFACAITSAAVSDLSFMMKTFTDYTDKIEDIDVLARHLTRLDRERMQFGADERTEAGRAKLIDRSPITHAAKIKTPLLMFHMTKDKGVYPVHSEKIVKVLKRENIPVTYLTFEDENHIIRKPENLLSFYPVVEAFLAQCLGGRATSVTLEDISHGTLTEHEGSEFVAGLKEAFSQK